MSEPEIGEHEVREPEMGDNEGGVNEVGENDGGENEGGENEGGENEGRENEGGENDVEEKPQPSLNEIEEAIQGNYFFYDVVRFMNVILKSCVLQIF